MKVMTTLGACRRYGGGKDAVDGYVAGFNDALKELEAENQKLREQRDAANAHIQFLNRVIAGDAE